MPNNRIFFATQAVGIAGDGTTSFTEIHGLQSVGITTTFNLEQVFEIGQIAIYENLENIPDVEVTLEKVLDGYPLIYHLATQDAPANTLAGRSAAKCILALDIYNDTNDSASGTPLTEVQCSGMFPSSLSYSFQVDGNFSESLTLVGNHKVWSAGASADFAPTFDNTDLPSTSVQRRRNLSYDYTYGAVDVNGAVTGSGTILPKEIPGITSSGTNVESASAYSAHVQRINVSVDQSREDLLELGRHAPYFRSINFPVEVTTEIEIIGVSGDMIDATEDTVLANQTIQVQADDSTTLYLGTKNKLSNVTYGGADAGGGNASITYSYSNFNTLVVTHNADPTF